MRWVRVRVGPKEAPADSESELPRVAEKLWERDHIVHDPALTLLSPEPKPDLAIYAATTIH